MGRFGKFGVADIHGHSFAVWLSAQTMAVVEKYVLSALCGLSGVVGWA